MPRQAFVHRFAAQSPNDTSAVEAAIRAGTLQAGAIIAILGKTEGNGCVNDFTRAFAVDAFTQMLLRHLDAAAVKQVAMVMSGGTEGGLSPHWIVFEVRQTEAPAQRSLALASTHTAPLAAEHLGRKQQVQMVAEGVRQAMAKAGLKDAKDVHYVQVKCPLLTIDRIEAAEARGAKTSVRDTLKSMGLSRAASALGVAVALGELSLADLPEEAIGRDWSLYSGRAATSAGVELLDHEIMVVGMSDEWTGSLAIESGVMADAIDIEPARAALSRLGFEAAGQLSKAQRGRIKAVLAKAEAAQSGRIREKRHIMLDDSDISSTRHARGFVAGALAGLFGFTDLFVSGGGEHQGPDGGGPVAVIAERS